MRGRADVASNDVMSCRFARVIEDGTACELMLRGGWQQVVAIEQLRKVGVAVVEAAELCPVAARGHWMRCPCRRLAAPPPLATLRL